MTFPHHNLQLYYSNMHTLTLADIERIAHNLGNAKGNANGYSCLCPAHDDRTPSLSMMACVLWKYIPCLVDFLWNIFFKLKG